MTSSITVKKEYPNVCRICLEDDPEDRHSIFDELPGHVNVTGTDEFNRIHTFLNSFTKIKAVQNDGLPYFICSDCLYLVQSAFNLYKLCDESRKYFEKIKIDISEEEIIISVESSEEDKFDNDLISIARDEAPVTDPLSDCVLENNDSGAVINVLQDVAVTNLECPTCKKIFMTSAQLVEHYESHRNEYVFCIPCEESFPTKEVYEEHYGLEHLAKKSTSNLDPKPSVVLHKKPILTDNLITDPIIKRIFNYEGKYTISLTSSGNQKMYICNTCNVEVEERRFKNHYDTHINPFYMCAHCKMTFHRRDLFIKHLKLTHPDSKYLKHLEPVNKPEVVQPCTTCTKVLPKPLPKPIVTKKKIELVTNPNLRRNIDYAGKFIEKLSGGRKVYECTKCKQEIRSKFFNFKIHYDTHLDPYYICEHCLETFHRGRDLRHHLKYNHPDSKHVKETDSKRETETSGKKHTDLVTDPNVPRNINYSGMYIERSRKCGKKEFECTKCREIMPHLNTFKNHFYKHIDPFYICPPCDQKFYQAVMLRKHLEEKHPESPYLKIVENPPLIKPPKQIKVLLKLQTNPNIERVVDFTGTFTMDFSAKPQKFKCNTCDKKFLDLSYFKIHYYTHLEPYYICLHCKSMFHRQIIFKRHLEKQHPELESASVDLTSNLVIVETYVDVEHSQLANKNEEKSVANDLKTESIMTVETIEENDIKMETNPNVERHLNYDGTFILKWHLDKQIYQCTQCENVLSTKEFFKIHYDKHLDPFYMCEYCNIKFHRQQTFRKHLVEKHPESPYVNIGESSKKPIESTAVHRSIDITGKYKEKLDEDGVTKLFECLTCGKNIRQSLIAFKNHYELHLDPFYKCKYCDKMFCRGQVYREHILTHSVKKRRIIPNANIVSERKPGELETNPNVKRDIDFSDKYVIKLNENEEKMFECVECKKMVSSNVSYFQRHYEMHLDAFYICPHCRSTFVNQHRFKVHLIKVHSSDKYCCDTCGKMYKTSKGLKDHIMTHQGIKPFKCDECGKRFIRKNDLITHKKIHNNMRPYICTYCGYTSKTNSQLHSHIRRRHTNEKKYACTHCDMAFVGSGQLKLHLAWHSDDRKHECKLCGKRFLRKNRLTDHLLMHAGRRFECTYCKNKFTTKQALSVHLKLYHAKAIKTE